MSRKPLSPTCTSTCGEFVKSGDNSGFIGRMPPQVVENLLLWLPWFTGTQRSRWCCRLDAIAFTELWLSKQVKGKLQLCDVTFAVLCWMGWHRWSSIFSRDVGLWRRRRCKQERLCQ